MPSIKSLLLPQKRGTVDYQAAGLPQSGASLSGTLGLLGLALVIELPFLFLTYLAPMVASDQPPWHIAWLLPARLIGLYGIFLTQRLQPLFANTWLRTPLRKTADLWWAWALPLVPLVILTIFHLMATAIQTPANGPTLFLVNTALTWLTFLMIAPTWLWCAVRSVLIANSVQSVTSDHYQAR